MIVKEFLQKCTHKQLRLLLMEIVEVMKLSNFKGETTPDMMQSASPLFEQAINTLPKFPNYTLADKISDLDILVRQQMVTRFVCFNFVGESEFHTVDNAHVDRSKLEDYYGC